VEDCTGGRKEREKQNKKKKRVYGGMEEIDLENKMTCKRNTENGVEPTWKG
jgi:hypothetical protein